MGDHALGGYPTGGYLQAFHCSARADEPVVHLPSRERSELQGFHL